MQQAELPKRGAASGGNVLPSDRPGLLQGLSLLLPWFYLVWVFEMGSVGKENESLGSDGMVYNSRLKQFACLR